ncbi:MAG TPA: sigma factor-like helix-turn-helix DNA-binding protein, partial [Candidatus Paceibacterota bacterium]|nr:sigma factor-like helix-turn-helix DNA-binding protein [Candidatus Paceibacterota bacterium]
RKHRRYLALLERFACSRSHASELENLEEEQLKEILAESLQELPTEDRDLINAKYLQGVAVKDLSVLTGVSDKAIESRLLRIRRQLRERLLKKLRKA